MGSRSRSGDQVGYVLWDEGGVVGFAMSVGDFFKKKPQVLVRVKPACLGGFDQAVECGGGIGPIGLPANNQFLRPTTKGRIAFSAALLSGVICPFSR